MDHDENTTWRAWAWVGAAAAAGGTVGAATVVMGLLSWFDMGIGVLTGLCWAVAVAEAIAVPRRSRHPWIGVTALVLGIGAAFVALPVGDGTGAVAIGGVTFAAGMVVPVHRLAAAAALDRERVMAVVRAVAPAVPFAVGVALLGLVLVIAVLAPDAGLYARVPAMLMNPATGVPIAFALGAGIYAFRRPSPPTALWWTRRHDLPDTLVAPAADALRRLRVYRVALMTLVFAVDGALLTVHNTVAADLPAQSQVVQRLTEALDAFPLFSAAASAYLLGVLLAELTRPATTGTPVGARLETRTPEQYLTRTARLLPAALGAAVVVLSGVAVLLHRPLVGYEIAAALAIPAAIAVAQRFIVRRPQAVVAPDALALDDTLRSSAAHALTGASSAVLLAVLSVLIDRVVYPGDSFGWPGVALALATIVGVYGVWSHYGATHRGRRPRRAARTTT